MRKDVGAAVNRMGTDPTEQWCLRLDGKLYAFGPES